MPNFQNYAAVHQVESGSSIYADVGNHCKRWSYYKGGGKITSVHEGTHGVNADLRNGGIDYKSMAQADYSDFPLGAAMFGLPVPAPSPYGDGLVGASGENAFYLLDNQAIKFKEPNCRKSDAIKYIPDSLIYYRHKLYVQGQREWDSQPLYLFDEWVAYANGAACAIQENTKDGSDWCFGPVEFIAYSVAVLMAAKAANSLDPKLANFGGWHLNRVVGLYNKGRENLPWKQMEECIDKLMTSTDSKVVEMRKFMDGELGFDITPPAPEDEINFMV